MLWTTLAFVLFTVAFATWHVRRTELGGGAALSALQSRSSLGRHPV